jgi:hypothetical protein
MAFVPDEAVYSSGEISSAAFKLYVCYCAHRSNKSGLAWPKRETIEMETGLNLTYISTMKGQLAAAKWIEIVGGRVELQSWKFRRHMNQPMNQLINQPMNQQETAALAICS